MPHVQIFSARIQMIVQIHENLLLKNQQCFTILGKVYVTHLYSITEYRDMIGQKVYYPIHKIATSEHPPLPICNNDVGDWTISMSITT